MAAQKVIGDEVTYCMWFLIAQNIHSNIAQQKLKAPRVIEVQERKRTFSWVVGGLTEEFTIFVD